MAFEKHWNLDFYLLNQERYVTTNVFNLFHVFELCFTGLYSC